eukprot:SAG11_NODE_1401_length_5015_cov_14.634662_4_plen_353_part_00
MLHQTRRSLRAIRSAVAAASSPRSLYHLSLHAAAEVPPPQLLRIGGCRCLWSAACNVLAAQRGVLRAHGSVLLLPAPPQEAAHDPHVGPPGDETEGPRHLWLTVLPLLQRQGYHVFRLLLPRLARPAGVASKPSEADAAASAVVAQQLVALVHSGRDVGRFAISSKLPGGQFEHIGGPLVLVGWGSMLPAAYHIADGMLAERGADAIGGVVALSSHEGAASLQLGGLADTLPVVRKRLEAHQVPLVECGGAEQGCDVGINRLAAAATPLAFVQAINSISSHAVTLRHNQRMRAKLTQTAWMRSKIHDLAVRTRHKHELRQSVAKFGIGGGDVIKQAKTDGRSRLRDDSQESL